MATDPDRDEEMRPMVNILRETAELAAEALGESINPTRKAAAEVIWDAIAALEVETVTIKEFLYRANERYGNGRPDNQAEDGGNR